MINKHKISLIIPCKNEEKIIYKTVTEVPSYVDEILVVDNGSSDASSSEARRAGAKVFSEPRKLDGIGYGYAHLTGIDNSTGDFIVGMDADGTYPVGEIENIVKHMLKNNLDVVCGSRLPLRNPKAISKTRAFGITLLNIETFLLYGYLLKDILTGMWVIRRSALSKLNLKMGDWNLSPEVKISSIANKDVRFAEHSIDHFVREKEPSKQQIWKTGFNHALYILKRRFTEDSLVGSALIRFVKNQKKLDNAASSLKFRFLI